MPKGYGDLEQEGEEHLKKKRCLSVSVSIVTVELFLLSYDLAQVDS